METTSAIVILVAVVAGALAGGILAWSAAPDLDDPTVSRRTIRRLVAEHPLVRRAARTVPRRAGAAVVEGVAFAAVVVTISAVAIGVMLVMIRTNTGLARADDPIADWAAGGATPGSTTVLRELSKFGGTAYVLIAAVGVTAYSWYRDRRWAVPLFVAVTMIGQFLVSNCIKWSVDRARPTASNLTGFSGSSFPSGHAVAAAAAWTSVAFLLGRGRSRSLRAALFGVAVALGVGVAGTRVALGVHWTTDVVAGLVVGWSWFAACAILFGGRQLRTAEPMVLARDRASPDPSTPV